MREIRFRGRRVFAPSDFVYGSLLLDYESKDHDDRHITAITYFDGFQRTAEVFPETVGQFTGLKDKNGVEIYEGDIIQWTVTYKSDFYKADAHSHSLLEVRWGTSGWVLWSELFKRFGMPKGDTCSEINTAGYTRNSIVIGNIYENPELLEAK